MIVWQLYKTYGSVEIFFENGTSVMLLGLEAKQLIDSISKCDDEEEVQILLEDYEELAE
jgi:hypothetical protein